MKKQFIRMSFLCFVMVSCAFALLSCEEEEYGNCSNERPYWCSSAKSCCKYRYNDGHSTCWETMEGCRSSGYPCETCHIKD